MTETEGFCWFYIECGNAVQVAIRAGYSMNYARAQSYKMLDNVGI
ncbi:MAG: terminase small subunit [Anaerocolumna sp.]